MTEKTARFALPQILPGQSQKEVFHNEALALVDSLLHPVVESRGINIPPGTPSLGQSWITGSAPTGDWSGEAGKLATWTAAGWRFSDPAEGMRIWLTADGKFTQRTGSTWVDGEILGDLLKIGGQQVVGAQQSAIADPAGGSVVDAEARSSLAAILAALRTHGLIAT